MENNNRVIVRPARVSEIVGLCRTTIWRLEREGTFPRSVKLGSHSKGFFLDEILAWLESRRAAV